VFGVNTQRPEILESVIIYVRSDYPEMLVQHMALARFQLSSGIAKFVTCNSVDFLELIMAFTKIDKSIVWRSICGLFINIWSFPSSDLMSVRSYF